jgi:hypothetical protein
MRNAHISALAALMALTGCSDAPVITISNRASVAISNVVVSGSGFSARVDVIPIGADHKLKVYPRGESGIRLAFDADGRHVNSEEQGYFESTGGYRVSVTVQPDMKVSVSSDLQKY